MKRKAPDGPSTEAKKGFWALGLLKTMKDPKYVIKTDNTVTVIKDMYPKARLHYLVLPNADINSLKSLTKEHVPLLKHMEQVAKDYVKDKHCEVNFKFGYHAEASMHRLHLHAISEDMDSPALKTKKHWNTFTTKFFLDSGDVLKSLESDGKVKLPSHEQCKQYLETHLKCHQCSYTPKNIPDLKKHIANHL